jgi:predicted nucleic acid-binding protein
MATILLDTSVIFDHLNGRAGRTEFLDRLLVEGHLLACCAVNITEVYAGLSARRGDQNRCFPQELEYLPVTPLIARQAGLLRGNWRTKGQALSFTDVSIAAVALSNATPLLTDNRKHFPMPGLELLPLPGDSKAR